MATVTYSYKPTGSALNRDAIQALMTGCKKSNKLKEHGSSRSVAVAYCCGDSLAKKQNLSIETEYNKMFWKIKNAKARKPRTFGHETVRHMHLPA